MAEENFEDPVVKFTCVGNLETCKRAFFANEFKTFEDELKSKPWCLYKAVYKFGSDKDGCPDYNARNLNSGFVQSLNGQAKYLFCAFRCVQPKEDEKKYEYPSLWISNVADPDLKPLLGSFYDDFEWTRVDATSETDFSSFMESFKKTPDDNVSVIGEKYFH
jgi:Elongation factor 1 gamma, conserved domain